MSEVGRAADAGASGGGLLVEGFFRSPHRVRMGDPRLLRATEQAAAALAVLDDAADGHPLQAALLYRTRLDAVRRQASVDGARIDEWHLAATLEGLRIRLGDELRIIDRCDVLESARSALHLHQWLTEPDFDQEGEVQAAEEHLAAGAPSGLILSAGLQLRSWLEAGGTRPPIRAALVRHWRRQRLLRLPLPVTGARALAADAPEDATEWAIAFCEAVAAEARDYRELLRRLEWEWTQARSQVVGRRSTSRASAAIDVLAAVPLLSATTLASVLGMSIKSAIALLDDFARRGIVVEVTHRSARRLFGLPGMRAVREVTTAPRRPVPGRGRGRPSEARIIETVVQVPRPPPLIRSERPPINYSALEAAIAHCEHTVRATRLVLDTEGNHEAHLLDVTAPRRRYQGSNSS